ncbi:MAG: 23S rRNA (guanosine(2251)-2'-O)-methyltransferase RlmB [Candidatus Methylomirabilales bacterium]
MAAEGGRVSIVTAVIGPRAVFEVLRAGERHVEKVFMVATGRSKILKEVLGLARARGVPVKTLERRALSNLAGGATHQGVVARVAAITYAAVEDLLEVARAREEAPCLVVMDGVEDPHNLGAVLRTAEAVGAHGAIIPKDRATGVSPTVAKAAAGALEYLRVARVPNLVQAIEGLKAAGLWVYGADAVGGRAPAEVDLSGPLALVLGGEGRGLRSLVRAHCDGILTIPTRGRIGVLNVSVAAGMLLYEVSSQRRRALGKKA